MKQIEWFSKGTRVESTAEPQAFITAQGRIGVNAAALESFGGEFPEQLMVGFDPTDRAIVLKPSDKGDGGYRLVRQGKVRASISGAAFLKHHSISIPEKTETYTPEFDEKQKVLWFKVGE